MTTSLKTFSKRLTPLELKAKIISRIKGATLGLGYLAAKDAEKKLTNPATTENK